MKKIIVSIALLSAMNFSAEAQFRVKIRPTIAVVHSRPICPSPHHVWIDDEYVWDSRRGDYVVIPGYWATPPPHSHFWVAGHWSNKHHHHRRWVAGHWSKR